MLCDDQRWDEAGVGEEGSGGGDADILMAGYTAGWQRPVHHCNTDAQLEVNFKKTAGAQKLQGIKGISSSATSFKLSGGTSPPTTSVSKEDQKEHFPLLPVVFGHPVDVFAST